MRRRDKNPLLSILVGTGLYLLDPARDRLADQIDSLSDRAKDVLDSASGGVRKVSRAITVEDRSGIGSTAALFLGVGVGVTLGILFAPASGEQIRRNIADTFQESGGRIRTRVSGESGGTATD
jgi:hypothetical protein